MSQQRARSGRGNVLQVRGFNSSCSSRTLCYCCSIFSISNFFNRNPCLDVRMKAEVKQHSYFDVCVIFTAGSFTAPGVMAERKSKERGRGEKERKGSSLESSDKEGLSLPCPFAFLTFAPIKIPLFLVWDTADRMTSHPNRARAAPEDHILNLMSSTFSRKLVSSYQHFNSSLY